MDGGELGAWLGVADLCIWPQAPSSSPRAPTFTPIPLLQNPLKLFVIGNLSQLAVMPLAPGWYSTVESDPRKSV